MCAFKKFDNYVWNVVCPEVTIPKRHDDSLQYGCDNAALILQAYINVYVYILSYLVYALIMIDIKHLYFIL
jgi:hypothetical protein